MSKLPDSEDEESLSERLGGQIQIQCNVGRLVEVRLRCLESIAVFYLIGRKMGAVLDGLSEPAVICADWRQVRVLSPDTGEALAAMMRRENPRVERSLAMVNPESATFGLQAERMIRETNHDNRRVFRDEVAAVKWLSQSLTDKEAARAREFLASES